MKIKLNDIAKLALSELGMELLSVTNIDDVFGILRCNGIDEVYVNFVEMHMITTFTLANVQNYNDLEKIKWEAIELIKEGVMDKFFGVKLVLEE